DKDGDGVNNEEDAFPENIGESVDTDGDGIGNNADPDDDNDNVADDEDAFPNDPTETSDFDQDGTGDNADLDDDNDNVPDDEDAFPNDPTETNDLDGDGIGDNSDTDRDGDDVANDSDAYPDDPTRSTLPIVTIDSPNTLITVGHTPIDVAGTADPSAVSLTLNGVPVTINNGTYSAQVTLEEGSNTIIARMVDNEGTVSTASIHISLDRTPPYITVESHQENQIVYNQPIALTGLVNDIVRGTVEESQANVLVEAGGTTIDAAISNRSYLAEGVPLIEGINTITISASDQVGNSETKILHLTYQHPQGQKLQLISGQGQSTLIDTILPEPLVLQVLDADNVPKVGETVVFRVIEGAGLVAPGSVDQGRAVVVTTDAEGKASTQFKLGLRSGVGNHAVRAQVVGFDDEIIFYATAENALGNKITVNSGNNQRGAIHRPLPDPFIVAVVDTGANLVQGARVEFKVTLGGGHFENGEPTITTTSDSDGRATAHLTLGGLEGLDVQRVTATLLDVADTVPQGETIYSGFTASALVIGEPGNTTITGIVLDNQDNPLEGVTIRVDGTTRQAVADEQGQFTITQAPVGPVHLIADGSTTTVEGEYPNLSYNLVTVSGAENPLSAPIYMVRLNQQSAKYAGLEDVEVTLDEVPGFKLTVPAGSVTFPDGSREGWVSVTAVNAGKVPMAPPNGMQPQLIVTIQPTGAMFDPPAPLTLPNVDGHLPGAQVEMYSYDHDLEEFVTIGLGTVNRDGTLIDSNIGIGVIKAGWHCGSQPEGDGCTHSCPTCKDCNGECECVPVDNDQRLTECQQCINGYSEADYGKDGWECDDDECKVCASGTCVEVSVDIGDISGSLCEGEKQEIGGSYYPAIVQGQYLEWTTQTPDKVDVYKISDTKAIVTARSNLSNFGQADVVGYYKTKGQCDEDYTEFEIFPKRADDRIGDISERYAFLLSECPAGMQQYESQVHPIDGCSAPGGIQSLMSPIIFSTFGPFFLYQIDSADLNGKPYPVWGEDLGDIPHNDPRASSQTLSCNKHDICYQTCGEDRGICDSALTKDAIKECKNHYPEDCPSTL
ncbi:MAG: hypothetical protein GY934_08005, partial [Gammaproteobacteria bacterium]|nr:hypothetical protein [Gammaproteobacteria bacterium]